MLLPYTSVKIRPRIVNKVPAMILSEISIKINVVCNKVHVISMKDSTWGATNWTHRVDNRRAIIDGLRKVNVEEDIKIY